MKRKVVAPHPIFKGELIERWEDRGPGEGKPWNPNSCNTAGGGSHLRGTKQPPSVTGGRSK